MKNTKRHHEAILEGEDIFNQDIIKFACDTTNLRELLFLFSSSLFSNHFHMPVYTEKLVYMFLTFFFHLTLYHAHSPLLNTFKNMILRHLNLYVYMGMSFHQLL